jgi:hypothetical protein
VGLWDPDNHFAFDDYRDVVVLGMAESSVGQGGNQK